VGTVEGVGAGVEAGWTGRRVGVAWLHRACGRCAFCRRGDENLCERPLFTGYDVDGGYADYLVAPADFIYDIPPGFAPETAAPLLCAGIIGYRSLRLAAVVPGCRVGLFGFGASAHIAIQIARHRGCEVSVVTRSPDHRRLAESLGAAWVGGPGDVPPEPLDAAVVFAPSGRVVVEALGRLRPGGTVAVNAIHLDGIPAFDYGLLYGERTVRSVSNSTRADGREFLSLAAAIPVRVETERMPLEEANQALARLRRREVSGAAVLAGSPGSG
jgi:propanol-preferring alcohol dehydrogenase